jgi:hypothetical protein
MQRLGALCVGSTWTREQAARVLGRLVPCSKLGAEQEVERELIATNSVALSTVRHAADADYRLVVVEDCCG